MASMGAINPYGHLIRSGKTNPPIHFYVSLY